MEKGANKLRNHFYKVFAVKDIEYEKKWGEKIAAQNRAAVFTTSWVVGVLTKNNR